MTIQGDLLLPYQRTWVEETAQVSVIEKSRRAGVSWATAGHDTLHCAARNGGNTWYMGQDKDMSQAYIADAGWWAKEIYGLACSDVETDVLQDGEQSILRHRIIYKSGFTQTALSSRPANLRSKGRPGDRFTFDECAFHPDFDGLLKAAGALMMWGCKLRFISTHNGEDNPFNLLIQDIRANKRPGVVHSITFKQAIEQGLYKRICQVTNKDWTQSTEDEWVQGIYDFYGDNANEELDIVPSSGNGMFLPSNLIRKCMVDATRIKTTWTA